MKRKLVMGLLAVGTVAGFGVGIANLGHRHETRHQRFEHMARVCVDATIDAREGTGFDPELTHHRRDHRIAQLCDRIAREP